MAVSINTVYQRVLAMANKEQRGYITPQEFNLLANQAQLEIFEQYFYDLSQFSRRPGVSLEYSDPIEIIEEKIAEFEKDHVDVTAVSGAVATLPSDVHKLGTVFYNNGTNSIIVENVSRKEVETMVQTALYAPSSARPVSARLEDNKIQLYPSSSSPAYSTSNINCHYIAKPATVSWGYNVVLQKAVYNASSTTDFELHASEETTLVNKILLLAGIVIEKPTISGLAGTMVNEEKQQEKA